MDKVNNFLRISIGIIFITSGLAKLFDLISFKEAILNFNIFPQYADLFAVTIPCFELFSGLCLLSGYFKDAAKIIILMLLILFTLVIAISLKRGLIFDCGCFGPINLFSKISVGKIIFNLIILIGLILLPIKIKLNIHLLSRLITISSYSFILSFLVYIPFSNKNLFYEINKDYLTSIRSEDLIEMIKNSNTIIFDTRPIEAYKQDHIPGALPLPINEFSKYFKKYKKIIKNSKIVFYCSSNDCMSSTKVAHMLIRRGYQNVFKLEGGIEEWKFHMLRIN